MTTEIILKILEIIGTVAFAVSGTFVAIKSKFDVFGVIVVGCVTAVGGGIIRDVLIGKTPPAIFSNLYILVIACLTSVLVFIFSYFKCDEFENFTIKTEKFNNYFDAVGLATFTVMGVELAFVNNFSVNPFLSITIGVLTGVGGGVLRDIFTANTPYIFTKHIYAVASILGAVIYYVLRVVFNSNIIPSIVVIIIVVSLRVFATIYRWSLPKVHLKTSVNGKTAENGKSDDTENTKVENVDNIVR